MLACALLVGSAFGGAGSAYDASTSGSPSILVRYSDDGAHGVEGCGASLHALGDHRDATRDHSDSLDRLHARFGVRRVRALMAGTQGVQGAPDATLENRRAHLQAMVQRTWARRRRARREAARGLPEMLSSRVRALAHVYRVELAPGVSPGEAARAYAADPHVEWAQVDMERVLDGYAPDPFLLSSGSWGQPYADLWGHHRIRAQEAWSESEGEGVVVAVVDTGLDWQHPDIAANVFVHPGEDLNGNGRVDDDEWNGIDDDGNGFIDDLVGFDFADSIDANGDGDYSDPGDVGDPDPFDDNGHGTHVAGIVAAVAGNGEGIAGVAPGARIMALKGFEADGRSSDAVLWRAVLYAALNGARVVNNSWSCGTPCPRNPLAEEVVELVHALGVTIVTSAGNRSRDVVAFSPENMWQTLTVGSSDVDDGPSLSFTNQGFGVDVLAPGGGPQDTPGPFVPRRNILSLRSSGGDPVEAPFEVGDGYIRLAGTSMSAPQVAGVAALLYAQRPELTPDALRRIVRRSAHDLGTPGHDWETGSGRLDAAAAVAEPPEPDWLLRVTSPRASAWFDPQAGPIEIRGTATGPDLHHFSVAVGEGVRPTAWTTIETSTSPVEDGVLALWRVEPDATGAHVIRVEAEARDGRRSVEFLPISFERLRFEVISSDGPEAERPAIHGRHVVWQSRRGEVEDDLGRRDLDLFEGGLGVAAERRLLAAPGDQTQPAISGDWRGRTYSWLNVTAPRDPKRAQACRVVGRRRGGDGECRAKDLGSPLGQTMAPVPLRDRVHWLDPRVEGEARTDLAACRFDPRGDECRPAPTGLDAGARAFLQGDGRGTLAWTAVDDGLRIAVCEIDAAGLCDEHRLPRGERALTSAAASRDLVAWVAGRLFAPRPLLACVSDADGGCDPVQIQPHAEDDRVRVSGDLVVWDGTAGDDPGDVFFCEFDRQLNRCPLQRLTSEGSLQDESDVDGRRIVWVDERFGPGRVAAVELPRWRTVGPRKARVGVPLQVVAWLHESGHGSVEVDVEAVRASDGGAAVTAPTISPRRSRAGILPVRLSWCPGPADVGRHVFTLHALTEDGLSTRISFPVEVGPTARARVDGRRGARFEAASWLPPRACAP